MPADWNHCWCLMCALCFALLCCIVELHARHKPLKSKRSEGLNAWPCRCWLLRWCWPSWARVCRAFIDLWFGYGFNFILSTSSSWKIAPPFQLFKELQWTESSTFWNSIYFLFLCRTCFHNSNVKLTTCCGRGRLWACPAWALWSWKFWDKGLGFGKHCYETRFLNSLLCAAAVEKCVIIMIYKHEKRLAEQVQDEIEVWICAVRVHFPV